jgi:hypothetical protein
MNRTRTAVASAAAVLMLALPVTPAIASPIQIANPDTSMAAGTGNERLCLGIDDPKAVGNSTTWVCTPEARWYADMIAFLLALTPA